MQNQQNPVQLFKAVSFLLFILIFSTLYLLYLSDLEPVQHAQKENMQALDNMIWFFTHIYEVVS